MDPTEYAFSPQELTPKTWCIHFGTWNWNKSRKTVMCHCYNPFVILHNPFVYLGHSLELYLAVCCITSYPLQIVSYKLCHFQVLQNRNSTMQDLPWKVDLTGQVIPAFMEAKGSLLCSQIHSWVSWILSTLSYHSFKIHFKIILSPNQARAVSSIHWLAVGMDLLVHHYIQTRAVNLTQSSLIHVVK